jgi:hypothetical protein
MRDMIPNLIDYEKTYREFKWEIPEYYNFGFEEIDQWAEDRTKLALISVNDTGIYAVRHTSYGLMRLSNQFAKAHLPSFRETFKGDPRTCGEDLATTKMPRGVGIFEGVAEDDHRKDQESGIKEQGDREEEKIMRRIEGVPFL